MLESTITPKGQITIPKAIRDRLGVKEGGGSSFCDARRGSGLESRPGDDS